MSISFSRAKFYHVTVILEWAAAAGNDPAGILGFSRADVSRGAEEREKKKKKKRVCLCESGESK